MSEPNSKIVIEVENWLDKNDNYEPKVTIVRVWALRREDLPVEYTRSYPSCWMSEHKESIGDQPGKRIKVEKNRNTVYELVQGNSYSKNFFDLALGDISECSIRLRELKKAKKECSEKNKILYKDWVGQKVVEVF